MKARLIVLSICMTAALSLSARMYEAGEMVYINSDQSSSSETDQKYNWKDADAKLFLYFYQSSNDLNNEWVTLTPIESGSNIFGGPINGNHPWYDRVIVVRKDPSGTAWNWDHKWNQSCNINIPDNGDCSCNLIDIYCGSTAQWKGLHLKQVAFLRLLI